ncbi:LPXTG cell wall anchor domain-containing protein, partial [Mammaliicoccus lentus]
PEGNVTAKATDKAENPNTSEASDSMKVTDTTPPAKPVIETDLIGKGGTTEPITVQAEPGSKVELFDKDDNKIGEGETDNNGVAMITPTKPLSEGNITAKATDKAETPNTSETSEPMKSTDTTAPSKPVIQTDLTGKDDGTDKPNTGGDDKPGKDNGSNKPSTGADDKPGKDNTTKSAGKDSNKADDNGMTNSNNNSNSKVNTDDKADSSMHEKHNSSMKQQGTTSSNGQNATSNMNSKDQPSKSDSNKDHKGAKVLPNTGEEESKQAGLLGITSLFGGLALLFRRKKSEDKE